MILEMEWHPVELGMPVASGQYITFDKYGYINIMDFDGEDFVMDVYDENGEYDGERIVEGITHWMSLPEPPCIVEEQ